MFASFKSSSIDNSNLVGILAIVGFIFSAVVSSLLALRLISLLGESKTTGLDLSITGGLTALSVLNLLLFIGYAVYVFTDLLNKLIHTIRTITFISYSITGVVAVAFLGLTVLMVINDRKLGLPFFAVCTIVALVEAGLLYVCRNKVHYYTMIYFPVVQLIHEHSIPIPIF